MNVVLLTGRAGSKSVPEKNVYPVLGQPLASYAMRAAKAARRVDKIYLSTDCDALKSLARQFHIDVIDRPNHLARDDSELVDAFTHALQAMASAPDYLVTMHCNCGVHKTGLIDECIDVMDADPSLDSCVSGTVDNSVHPFRTRQVSADGNLVPWMAIPSGTSSNRQNLSPCFILDGAVRVLRVANCFPPSGSPPFAYLGNKIGWVENPGPGDVHSLSDISATAQFLADKAEPD